MACPGNSLFATLMKPEPVRHGTPRESKFKEVAKRLFFG